jgi:hypothetical protein
MAPQLILFLRSSFPEHAFTSFLVIYPCFSSGQYLYSEKLTDDGHQEGLKIPYRIRTGDGLPNFCVHCPTVKDSGNVYLSCKGGPMASGTSVQSPNEPRHKSASGDFHRRNVGLKRKEAQKLLATTPQEFEIPSRHLKKQPEVRA